MGRSIKIKDNTNTALYPVTMAELVHLNGGMDLETSITNINNEQRTQNKKIQYTVIPFYRIVNNVNLTLASLGNVDYIPVYDATRGTILFQYGLNQYYINCPDSDYYGEVGLNGVTPFTDKIYLYTENGETKLYMYKDNKLKEVNEELYSDNGTFKNLTANNIDINGFADVNGFIFDGDLWYKSENENDIRLSPKGVNFNVDTTLKNLNVNGDATLKAGVNLNSATLKYTHFDIKEDIDDNIIIVPNEEVVNNGGDSNPLCVITTDNIEVIKPLYTGDFNTSSITCNVANFNGKTSFSYYDSSKRKRVNILQVDVNNKTTTFNNGVTKWNDAQDNGNNVTLLEINPKEYYVNVNGPIRHTNENLVLGNYENDGSVQFIEDILLEDRCITIDDTTNSKTAIFLHPEEANINVPITFEDRLGLDANASITFHDENGNMKFNLDQNGMWLYDYHCNNFVSFDGANEEISFYRGVTKWYNSGSSNYPCMFEINAENGNINVNCPIDFNDEITISGLCVVNAQQMQFFDGTETKVCIDAPNNEVRFYETYLYCNGTEILDEFGNANFNTLSVNNKNLSEYIPKFEYDPTTKTLKITSGQAVPQKING
jgi:hypothetical protein